MPRGESGVVTLGFTATTAYSFLEHVLTAADARLPRVDLVLREMVTSTQLEALLAGSMDLGMIRPPAVGADDRPQGLRGRGRLCRRLAPARDDGGRRERGGEHEGAQDPWGHAQWHRCL